MSSNARTLTVAAAQLGPVQRRDSRTMVVRRMLSLMDEAAERGAGLVVFPELALTSFFPRWVLADNERDAFFERELPSSETRPLFERAAALGLGFYLGYAELAGEGALLHRFNTAILVNESGQIVSKYRKIHLPGTTEPDGAYPVQHLEKRYFEVGDLGFPVVDAFGARVGLLLCNDRRWPEAFRCLGLQGVELVAVGYNTPAHDPEVPQLDPLQDFHNQLCLQAGAYHNGSWVVGVAKAGPEAGCELIGGTAIVAPTGELVAQCQTLGDELIVAECNLDRCRDIKDHIFNFARHRQPRHYARLTETADHDSSSFEEQS